MKKNDYQNLKEDEHVYHSWEVLDFKINNNYDYVSSNIFLNFISNILIIPIALILYILDKVLFGFKMTVDAGVPIKPVKFILKEKTGIYKLYKRNKCIHAVIIEPIYPNLSLPYEERINDLKERTYEKMKETIWKY